MVATDSDLTIWDDGGVLDGVVVIEEVRARSGVGSLVLPFSFGQLRGSRVNSDGLSRLGLFSPAHELARELARIRGTRVP